MFARCSVLQIVRYTIYDYHIDGLADISLYIRTLFLILIGKIKVLALPLLRRVLVGR